MNNFCSNCGTKLTESSNFCSNCGEPVNQDERYTKMISNTQERTYADVSDTGVFGWGLIGWIFPIVGYILGLIWAVKKPRCSKALIWGANIKMIMYILTLGLVFIAVVYG